MYGMIVVEPEGGLPQVDREFYVMHALSRAERGLAGQLIVDSPKDDDIMHAGPAKGAAK